MMAAERRCFSICFYFEKELLSLNFWRKQSIQHCYFHPFHSIKTYLPMPEKTHLSGKYQLRSTKHVYNRRFLGSCFVKSHRGSFCTYHKHSLSNNSKRYLSNQTGFLQNFVSNTLEVASYGCNRLQLCFWRMQPTKTSFREK